MLRKNQSPAQTYSARSSQEARLRPAVVVDAGVPRPASERCEAAGGVGLLADVGQLCGNTDQLQRFVGSLRSLRRHDLALTITFAGLSGHPDPVQLLEQFCGALQAAGVQRSRRIACCMADSAVPLRSFVLVTRCWLGDGPRYLAFPDRGGVLQPSSQNWSYLWRMRRSRWAVWPLYGGAVSSSCPLLSSERARSVVPGFGLHAPAESAWVPVRLHLPAFAGTDGQLNFEHLEAALISSVDAADKLVEHIDWPLDAVREDAAVNRRIGLLISGFGDLTVLQRRDPGHLATLHAMLKVARHVREVAWQHSARLAKSASLLPALVAANPAIASGETAGDEAWTRQWQGALSRNAVRHRNLLLMSPYSVLPGGAACRAKFADLLPVIGLADAFAFADPPAFAGWNFKEFKHFHCRAQAEIDRHKNRSIVATRV